MRVLHRCRTVITNQHETAGRPNVAGILLNASLAGWFQLYGYRILARRWRCAAGEIDLFVKRRQQLVFVEVKYRFHADQIVMPSSTQCRRIRSAAALLLDKYSEMSDAQCRFDLLIINHGRIFGVGRIVHLKNAWQ